MGMDAQQAEIRAAGSKLNRLLRRAVPEIEAELRIGLPRRNKLMRMSFHARSNPQQYVHRDALLRSNCLQQMQLREIVHDEAANACINCHFQLIQRLVVAMEMNALGWEAGLQGCVQLPFGDDVQ
ncbi:hypothetical protein D3C77_453820 [compost metagenome]